MSWTSDLLDGLARLIAEAGVGVYRDTGVYTVDEVGITITAVPDQPDQIVCLTPYPVDDTSGTTDVLFGVQFRFRAGADPRAVLAREDATFELLHMREHTDIGGVHVGLMWRQSASWIGADSRGRNELTANYYLRAIRPAPLLIET
ncbi:minor capsid protein [Streptomyces malaysiensis]|uniref:minor capsid protein n=1 Tax=Streptomyces malaysiensis TaxID=92644 RepID=UPI0011CD4EF6|nr:minor capsid protein [Streptomyces malaysiensis]